MNTNISLIILHLNLQNGEHGCLFDEETLPKQILNDNNIAKGLINLLTEHLDIDHRWVNFALIDVVAEDEDINIIYGCLIPAVVESKIGKWKTASEINDSNTKKLVFKATQKIC